MDCVVQVNGISKILPIGKLSEYEAGLLAAVIPELQGSISSTSRVLSSPVL